MLFGSGADWNFGLGMPPKEGKKFIDDLGVKIVGCHLGPDVMKDEARLTEFLDYQAAVGCWSPGLAADHYHDADDVKKRCELFNHVGELCRERGMVFHYHNHFHEFQIFDGQYEMCIRDSWRSP